MKQIKQKFSKSIGIGIFVMLLVISGVFASQTESANLTDIDRTIDVSGTAQIDVAPDQAVIYITIKTQGRDQQKVQDKNTLDMDALMSSLTRMGIETKNIETSRYSVQPWNEYNPISRKYDSKGYKVDHTIKVTVKDLATVGEVLALAVENGATNIDNVQFTLSKEAQDNVLIELYALAAQNGQTKAFAIGEGLDLKVGKAVYISEMNYQPIQWDNQRYAMAAFEEMDAVASSAPTINPQEQTLRVTLQMTFSFA
jgi:uncharacterized protein